MRENYMELIAGYPTIVNRRVTRGWDPISEVSLRKEDKSRYPYCLFTSYFANTYFGIRQSVEIDSIRYAIERECSSEIQRDLALGALINTISALAITYGGHFAQPKYSDYQKINLSTLAKIVDKRALSINHEFSVRLLSLAQQSQTKQNRINIVDGPWQTALNTLKESLRNTSGIIVYLDAPYKREEYSRYYHALETLVKYDYPSCTGKGLIPGSPDRFKSEFFTKNKTNIEKILQNIIVDVLNNNWTCVWSYSSSGDACIMNTVDKIHAVTKCNIKSYSTPFTHKGHRGVKSKNVTEYLIIFSPS